MTQKLRNANPAAVVERMSDYARTTRNDRLANAVAHAASRLAHQGAICENPLTLAEFKIIRPFLNVR
jgi:hypothetical protein